MNQTVLGISGTSRADVFDFDDRTLVDWVIDTVFPSAMLMFKAGTLFLNAISQYHVEQSRVQKFIKAY
jgi:hypothetical protein